MEIVEGMIQVYTGNGKGKTTAAIGLTVRALGAGKKVMFLQFMKARGYSEHKILSGFAPALCLETVGKPFFVVPDGVMTPEDKAKWEDSVVIFPPGNPPADYLAIVNEGMAKAAEALSSGMYDVVVLDEINCALHFALVAWPEVESMLNNKAEKTEVILTGRGAPEALVAKAHLVTEMKEIKHYYNDLGLEARLGIEN